MKKITTSLLAIFAFSAISYAQTPEKTDKQDVRFRVKSGLNISNVSDDSDSKSKAGFHIGGAVEIFVTDKFSIQPELQYSMQGTQSKNDLIIDGMIASNIKVNTNYLNIPVMAKYYVAEGFSIQAGPQLGFLVKSELKTDLSNGYEKISVTSNIKSNTNKVDFGLNFGVAYDLSFGLFFDARYNLGLTDILKNADGQHRVFQLGVGYKF
ncbi:porin family protein [Myroides odoratus]|uniref:porin family protein n=1 Tax=Myroides odoratus TaxID=256 RepID=UPI00333EE745